MINLVVQGTALSGDKTGVVDIRAGGTVSQYANKSDTSLTLTTYQQLSEPDWYAEYINSKLLSMELGGTLSYDLCSDAVFNFDKGGYTNTYLAGAVQSLHGAEPNNTGDLAIVSDKLLEISDNGNNEIVITLPIHHPQINSMYRDIYLLTWRLYHCINSLAGRLMVYNPDIPRDGNPHITRMGYYLGTYLNYQALIARWNHFAWSNAFTLAIVEAGERATVVVGYTNLNCNTTGFGYDLNIYLLKTASAAETNITEDVTVTDEATNPFVEFTEGWLDADSPTEDNIVDKEISGSWSRDLTLFNQGVESTLNADQVMITTSYRRNGQVCSGTGYEGKVTDPLRGLDTEGVSGASLSLSTAITAINVPGSEPSRNYYIQPEQYHRDIIAIAPCSGIAQAYSIQKPDIINKVYHLFAAQATWMIGDKQYTKRKYFKIAAVTIK